MKKLILTLLFVGIVRLACAAIPADTIWDCRNTEAGASDANGGGYSAVTGGVNSKDYSLLSTTMTWNDLGVGIGTTAVTSAAGGFTSSMPGNILRINGTNFTSGPYMIMSIINANSLVIDRLVNAGTAVTNGVGILGGALANPQAVVSCGVGGTGPAYQNTVYIKNVGTYGTSPYNSSNVLRVVTPPSGANTANNTINWIGYNSTREDAPTGNNRPLFSGGADTISTAAYWNIFWNLRITGSSDDLVNWESAGTNSFFNCKLYAAGDKALNIAADYGGGTLYHCEIANNSSSAGASGNLGASNQFLDSAIYNNGAIAINYNYPYLTLTNCAVFSNIGGGVLAGDGGNTGIVISAYNSVFYNNTGAAGDGIKCNSNATNSGSGGGSVVYNNIFMNNGRYAVSDLKGISYRKRMLYFDYNLYYGNTSPALLNITAGAHDVTSNPSFVSSGATPPNFTLQVGSPAIGAGYPDANWAANVGLASANYSWNIGVDQGDHSSGTSSGGALNVAY